MPVCDGASQTGYLGAESAHSDIGIKDVYRPATGALSTIEIGVEHGPGEHAPRAAPTEPQVALATIRAFG